MWVLKCIDELYECLVVEISEEEDEPELLIFDRCLDSCEIFLDTAHARRYLTDLEYYMVKHHIDQTHSKYFGSQLFAVDKICYIDTSIQECMKRVKTRARESELLFDKELESYQHFLAHFYNEYLKLFEVSKGADSILRLDTHTSTEQNPVDCFMTFAKNLIPQC
jgi:deoxyadenosine/deoxycytidine kinase